MRIAKARPFEGKPIINMPSVYGGCIGKEIICRVPVIGTRPIRVEVQGLPQGLRLDGQVIRGTVPEGGEFRVRIAAENGLGRAEQDVTFRIGEDTIPATRPMCRMKTPVASTNGMLPWMPSGDGCISFWRACPPAALCM